MGIRLARRYRSISVIGVDSRTVRAYIKSAYKVEDLLHRYHGISIGVGETFRCCYHDDRRKSAKLYADNSFWCYACCRQFDPYTIMIMAGVKPKDLEKLVPVGYVPTEIKGRSSVSKLASAVTVIGTQFKNDKDLYRLLESWIKVANELSEKRQDSVQVGPAVGQRKH